MILCPLCDKPVNKYAEDTWKEVRGWVGGPRKDSMRLRLDTGRYAHNECVRREQEGQAPDQPSLFEAGQYELPPSGKPNKPPELPEILQ